MKTEDREKLLQAALEYARRGLSIIPVNRKKQPVLPRWKTFQTRIPSEDEINQWFVDYEPDGIAIITGTISGIIVVDFEKDADFTGLDLPKTPSARSGGGGIHYYYRNPKNVKVGNKIRFRDKTDLKAEGGYVLAPPSSHFSGGIYEWLEKLETPFADPPKWVPINKKTTEEKHREKDIVGNYSNSFEGKSDGERHNAALQHTGKLLRRFPPSEWDIAWTIIQDWNQKNKPPLDDDELRSIFFGISEKERGQREQGERKPKRPLLTMGDLIAQKPMENPFLVEPLVPSMGITAVSGHPGSGKTWIILHIAFCVAEGVPLFDKFKTTQGAVLLIDEENGIFETKRRLEMLDYMLKRLPIYFYIQGHFKIDKRSDMEQLKETLREKNISLVIFDPFAQMHSKVENNAEEASLLMEYLQEINEMGVSVIFIHHHRKDSKGKSGGGQSLRGSSAFSGRLDSHVMVKKMNSDNVNDEVNVIHEKSRRGKAGKPFRITITERKGKIYFTNFTELTKAKTKKDEVRELILSTLQDGELSKEELEDVSKREVGVSGRTVSDVLKWLVESLNVFVRKDGRKNIYRLPTKEEEEKRLKDQETLERNLESSSDGEDSDDDDEGDYL